MTFKDAIIKADAKKVLNILKDMHVHPSHLNLYKQILNDLVHTTPANIEDRILIAIDWVETGNKTGEGYFQVHGVDKEQRLWSLMATPWNEWLAAETDRRFITMNGLNKYVAYCLCEMTALGFTDESLLI